LVDQARRWLSELDRLQHSATLAHITEHIESLFLLPPGALRAAGRDQRTVFARQVAIYLCRKTTGASLRSIAKHFQRKHSTALYGLKLIQRQTETDAALRRRIAQMAAHLRGGSNRATRRSAKQPNGGYHAEPNRRASNEAKGGTLWDANS
jgi:chromosomal replication initiator protein